jgi:16S rRNA A1518/A1519 N6-dimethyltransferase RsmA/KsgA/DIM1 with predicted DNA glycosylase/AP lyase activity
MTLAGAAMQLLADVDRLFRIPAAATWPVPDVDSVYLRLTPKTPDPEARQRVLAALKQGFAHPRKRVLAAFTKDTKTQEALVHTCGVPLDARPQELSLSQWKCIADNTSAR